MFPGRQQKRRLVEEEEEEKKEGGAKKKVKKEENENIYRIYAKNFTKAEEQGEMKVVAEARQEKLNRSPESVSISPNQVVTIVAREGQSPPKTNNQRSPKLISGSSPTIGGGGVIHCGQTQQSPLTPKSKMIPSTALKQVCKHIFQPCLDFC